MKNEKKYNPNDIEKHWQSVWEQNKTYSPDIDNAKSPFYNLMMFPYPSAEGLHVGNMYAFTGADVYGRFKRMQGNDVFEPIGLDGFGIHSENYALKIGKHPKEQAEKSQENFYRQLKSIGNGFDLTRTLETYNPEYYKWTQWLFITLFKSGLAYRKKAEVNWCPLDNTVLADEQVIDGKCERDGATVEKRELEQWFFRITKYAERLLNNIEGLDWSEKVKIAQRNWIGRSEGAQIEFKIQNSKFKIEVFTTRPDTLYGATFMVISPEHKIASQIESGEVRIENSEEVKAYIRLAKKKTDTERTAEGKEKTGVFSGLYAINPVSGKKIPVWIADYVLSSYGTGAIMAVPAHDQRDFEFAKKYDLEIIPVIKEKEEKDIGVKMEKATSGQGTIMGSEEWNGFHVPEDLSKVIDDLETRGLGSRKVNYHLRDWLISRQRYWGPPIPMLYCSNCAKEGKSWFDTSEAKSQHREIKNLKLKIKNSEAWDASGWYPVSEKDLPVLLPDVEDWRPLGTGKAPLANHPEFYEVKCPECGESAIRETDVSDTFLDSSWYFLRYPSVGYKKSNIKDKIDTNVSKDKLNQQNSQLSILNSQLPWDPEITRRWLPVDMYIGGAEHSVLHLLYSRFITMVLKDLGYLEFEEPFSRFYAHGLIIKDGAKMSKSKGNVVVPDEYIAKYGADSLRTYLMFIGPYSDGGDFRDSGIEGINRFLRRVWKLLSESQVESGELRVESEGKRELDRMMHKTIKGVTEDLENLRYNTAIAKLMEYYNELNKFYTNHQSLSTQHIKSFLLLLAPFAPHLTEELWQRLRPLEINADTKKSVDIHGFNQRKSIHVSEWPEFDTAMLVSDTFTIVVQVNGKRRGEMQVGSATLEVRSEIEEEAKKLVEKYIEGKQIRQTIYVKGKIVNFVI